MSEIGFQETRHCLTLLLPEDLGGAFLEDIRNQILNAVTARRDIRAVIFDCSNLRLIDLLDIGTLINLVNCIKLMGKKVGFCSISAALAAVLVNSELALADCTYGFNLDDAIGKLQLQA